MLKEDVGSEIDIIISIDIKGEAMRERQRERERERQRDGQWGRENERGKCKLRNHKVKYVMYNTTKIWIFNSMTCSLWANARDCILLRLAES